MKSVSTAVPKVGGVFDVFAGDFQHFRDVVDDDAGGELAAARGGFRRR